MTYANNYRKGQPTAHDYGLGKRRYGTIVSGPWKDVNALVESLSADGHWVGIELRGGLNAVRGDAQPHWEIYSTHEDRQCQAEVERRAGQHPRITVEATVADRDITWYSDLHVPADAVIWHQLWERGGHAAISLDRLCVGSTGKLFIGDIKDLAANLSAENPVLVTVEVEPEGRRHIHLSVPFGARGEITEVSGRRPSWEECIPVDSLALGDTTATRLPLLPTAFARRDGFFNAAGRAEQPASIRRVGRSPKRLLIVEGPFAAGHPTVSGPGSGGGHAL